MFKNSKYLSLKHVISLIRFSKSIPNYITIKDETYIDTHSKLLPLKVIKGKNQLGRSLILFPGASPLAEEHPTMHFLASVLANTGFNVYIPRIPLLKNLNVSEKNIEYLHKAYKEILNREDIKGTLVSCMGVSYGGALVLKASLSGVMKQTPPHSIITYGTIYDIQTSLDFLITGKLNIKGKEVNIKPHEWGLIVVFHNFLPDVDIGYDTCEIQHILKLRVQDKEIKSEINKLSMENKTLVNDILNANITSEIKRIIDIILRDKMQKLNAISPEHWANEVNSKVFIMHGANDNMVPYTQSIQLSKDIKNSELFISYLYEHNKITPKHSLLYKFNELKRLIQYIHSIIKYHEN